MNTYKTLKGKSASFFKEKASKFYGYAFPILSKEDVQLCIEEIRKEHPKARHICSAFLIGTGNDEYYLVNDDGEPSNSAGLPILGQIRSFGITNCYIAVVRYFGGTKLGVGGLIQAYKHAAADTINANTIIEVEPTFEVSFKLGFDKMGTILSHLDKMNLKMNIENLQDGVKIILQCTEEDKEKVNSLLTRFTLQ